VVSPLLANVYLHYSFDLWVNVWRQKWAQGKVVVIGYADDSAPRRREGGLMRLH
jgi:RNA-directed DNA polymerase